jgi:uncharacterized membrane protein YhaH (DUF805 family)
MLINAFKLVVLERYAQFEGRAGRAEYWWYVLANFLVFLVLAVLMGVSDIFTVLYFLAALALFIPSLAAAVRRLHDTSKSGWWLLTGFIPFVGWIILIVLLAAQPTPGANEYGVTATGP